MSKQVLIIGGGLSGLTAARILQKQEGVDVIVLEARDRVGGRTHTVTDPTYGSVDLGGAYVGPGQDKLKKLAKELGIDIYDVYCKGQMVIDTSSLKARVHAVGTHISDIPTYNPIKLWDAYSFITRVEKMAKQVPPDAPWNAPRAQEWDQVTFEEFVKSVSWTSIPKLYGRIIIQTLFCCEPSHVSLLAALWYFNCGGGLENMTMIKNGAQEQKFVGGSQQISDKMAEQLGLGSKVKLNQEVVSIDDTGEKVKVTTACGEVYEVDHVISAMPLALLPRVRFSPPLSASKAQMLQRVPMGSVIKTVMFYAQAFWRDMNLTGELATDYGPVAYSIDDCSSDGKHARIMGFILSTKAQQLTVKTPEERKSLLCQQYSKMFDDPRFAEPVHYMEQDWSAELYSGGCYGSYYAPGVLTQFGPIMREPHGRVVFAGTETATNWSGYMEGAIQAGERAAQEVIQRLSKKG